MPNISDGFEMFYYKKAGATVTNDSSSSLSTLTQNAQKAFDSGEYTVALFADSVGAKTSFTNALKSQSTVSHAVKSANLGLRCSDTYSYSTVSAADGGVGGCIIFVKFNYHPCDVDQNSYVEKADAELILNALCENIPTKSSHDADQNGSITVYDAVFVLKTIKDNT